jgi:hypothetical protein
MHAPAWRSGHFVHTFRGNQRRKDIPCPLDQIAPYPTMIVVLD